jgi:hypothetical protein
VCVVAVATQKPQPLHEYKKVVHDAVAVDHLTVEVRQVP